MTLAFSIAASVVFIGLGIYCRGLKRLRNTSTGMIFFGCVMALYSVLTLLGAGQV